RAAPPRVTSAFGKAECRVYVIALATTDLWRSKLRSNLSPVRDALGVFLMFYDPECTKAAYRGPLYRLGRSL
ncbi:hypothetical protein, partial [Agrobacterium tumefaciens]|uniref:hypothetical protein n=1 Tax=Agrobacterium tumefaciens TaxID=358 RepID=UPI001AEDB61E